MTDKDSAELIDYARCPVRPNNMSQSRYKDLCHLFAEYGYNRKAFMKAVDQINNSASIIHICTACGKVDIKQLSHWRECSPQAESLRQQNQEVYWK